MPDGRMVYVDMPSNINADELCAVVAWLLGPAKQQLDASRREAEPARQPTRRLWVPQ